MLAVINTWIKDTNVISLQPNGNSMTMRLDDGSMITLDNHTIMRLMSIIEREKKLKENK